MSDTSTVYVRPPIGALIAAVIIGGIFYITGKNIETRYHGEPGTIVVSADAKESATPDIAQLDFGVTAGRQSTAKDAMKKLSDSMSAVIDAVKKAGVAEKDIQTQSLWLNPQYDYTNGAQVPHGFEASESLTVKVRDMDKAGDVLAAATNAGANQAGGINFTIDDPEASRAKARAAAIQKAQDKARQLASDLGVHLIKLKSFSENTGNMPPPIMYDKMANVPGGMGGGVASVPLPAGQQEISVEVSLTYEVE